MTEELKPPIRLARRDLEQRLTLAMSDLEAAQNKATNWKELALEREREIKRLKDSESADWRKFVALTTRDEQIKMLGQKIVTLERALKDTRAVAERRGDAYNRESDEDERPGYIPLTHHDR